MKATLVRMRFFAGMTVPEAAQSLGISVATAERYWAYAPSWLYADLSRDRKMEKIRKISVIGEGFCGIFSPL